MTNDRGCQPDGRFRNNWNILNILNNWKLNGCFFGINSRKSVIRHLNRSAPVFPVPPLDKPGRLSYNFHRVKRRHKPPAAMSLHWRPFHGLSGRRAAGFWPPSAVSGLLTLAGLGLGACWGLSLTSRADLAAVLREHAGLSAEGLRAGRFWQLLTSLFLPASALWLLCVHLPLFWLAGRHLERIAGRRHVVALFLLAGAAGGLAQAAYDGWALHRASVVLLGLSAPTVAVFTALAGIVPELELVPPLALSTGSHGPAWLRIKHGAVGVLAVFGVALLARPHGAFASEQAVRCLVGGLVGSLYVRQLGFGRRQRPTQPTDPEIVATEAAAEVAAEAASGWMAEDPHPTAVAAPVAAAAGALVVPRFTERERRMTVREYISEQIDPILEKISRHGLGSLNDAERRILEKGREKIAAANSTQPR